MDSRFGKLIGEGISRWVYEYIPDSQWVIKVNKGNVVYFDKPAFHDANADEFYWYNEMKKINMNRWFAECKYHNGLFLMRKASPLLPGRYFIPTWFKDRGKENWGVVDGKIVSIDYAWLHIKKSPTWYIEDNLVKRANVPIEAFSTTKTKELVIKE